MAMRRHLIDLRRDMPGLARRGYDQRTGEVVLLVRGEDAQRFGLDAIRARAEQVGGVPVRVMINDLNESNMSVVGGGRVEGTDRTAIASAAPAGFVVTDGSRDGIATAAHCPDELVYRDPERDKFPLAFAGSWGAAYQDVQINVSPEASRALVLRRPRQRDRCGRVQSWRNLAATRAGDFVCHWGESSHYSCATVELTDYAPPGELCGGPCEPTWVTVAGPSCNTGDSGGPVFSGVGRLRHRQGHQPPPRRPLRLLLLHVDRLSAAAVAAAL